MSFTTASSGDRERIRTPPSAVFATVSVRALVPPAVPAIVAGENAAVTPLGKPVTVKATVELKPFLRCRAATFRLVALP